MLQTTEEGKKQAQKDLLVFRRLKSVYWTSGYASGTMGSPVKVFIFQIHRAFVIGTLWAEVGFGLNLFHNSSIYDECQTQSVSTEVSTLL